MINHIDRHPDLKDQSELLDGILGWQSDYCQIIGLLGMLQRFDHAKALAAFVGLNPTAGISPEFR